MPAVTRSRWSTSPAGHSNSVIPAEGIATRRRASYGIAIASGVAAAHDAGVVHRDLKPGNVMVTDAGHVKVLDFGLAKLREVVTHDEATRTREQTAAGTIVGTASYMSPEQAEGLKVDARSDIFSFGALLYEMVTGRRAFHGETPMSTITAILRDQPAPIAPTTPMFPTSSSGSSSAASERIPTVAIRR